jgi:hypothetical protein
LPSVVEVLGLVSAGVATGLQFDIPARSRRKYLRLPMSLTAKADLSFAKISSRRPVDDADRTMSSTYRRRYAVPVEEWSTNRDESMETKSCIILFNTYPPSTSDKVKMFYLYNY